MSESTESEFTDSQSSEYLSEHEFDREFADEMHLRNSDDEFEPSSEPSSEDFADKDTK
jgi:hypothetical protein